MERCGAAHPQYGPCGQSKGHERIRKYLDPDMQALLGKRFADGIVFDHVAVVTMCGVTPPCWNDADVPAPQVRAPYQARTTEAANDALRRLVHEAWRVPANRERDADLILDVIAERDALREHVAFLSRPDGREEDYDD